MQTETSSDLEPVTPRARADDDLDLALALAALGGQVRAPGAAKLQAQITTAEVKAWSSGTASDWALEGLKNRVTNAVDLTEDRKKLLIKRLDALLQEIEKPRFNIREFAFTVAAVAAAVASLETAAIQAPETIARLLEVVDLAHGKQAERLCHNGKSGGGRERRKNCQMT